MTRPSLSTSMPSTTCVRLFAESSDLMTEVSGLVMAFGVLLLAGLAFIFAELQWEKNLWTRNVIKYVCMFTEVGVR